MSAQLNANSSALWIALRLTQDGGREAQNLDKLQRVEAMASRRNVGFW
jgi:hypothetical protein